MRPEPIHIIILLIVILLIFGAPKLPMIAKNLGKSMKIFKSEVKDLRGDNEEKTTEPGRLTDGRERTDVRPATTEEAAAHRASGEEAGAERPEAENREPRDQHPYA